MTKEQEAEVIQFVKIQIQEAIGRANLMAILQDLHLTPEQKVLQCDEVLKGVKAAIEKIKSNGTAI
jgi:hypothetical protein